MGENECASAKGGFGIAWRKAGLPNGRRLLIARRPANFYGAAEKFRSGFTNRSGGIDAFRHGRSRYPKARQQFAIPSRRIEWPHRKHVVEGKSSEVRVNLGVRPIKKKKKQ